MKTILFTLVLGFSGLAVASAGSNDCSKYWFRHSKGGFRLGPMDGIAYIEMCNRDKNCKFPYDVYALAYGKTETPEMKQVSLISRRW